MMPATADMFLLLLLCLCCPAAPSSSPPEPPPTASVPLSSSGGGRRGDSSRLDIIFHVIDDLGWNDLGFRNSDISSPSLDTLAASGIVLADYHQFWWCSPTRSSLLSGRIPYHNGFVTDAGQPKYGRGFNGMNTEYGISANFTFLPEVLRSAGIETHAVGKWHLGGFSPVYAPTARGFFSFFGYLGGAEDYFWHNVSSTNYSGDGGKCSGLDFLSGTAAAPGFAGAYSAGIFGAHASDIVRRTPLPTPLFVYLAWQSVHSPVQAPAALIEKFRGRPRPEFTAMVKSLDDAVGAVEHALHESGRHERTVRIVTTDNGGCFWSFGNNHPLRGNKLSAWDGGTRGLAFVSSPLLSGGRASARPGTIHNSSILMHACDWFATILDIVGLPPTALPATAVDSVSQWAALTEGVATGPRTTLLHHVTADGRGKVRDGDWQLYTQNASEPGGFFSLCNPVQDGWSGNPTTATPHGATEVPVGGPAACGISPCLYNVSLGADYAERHNVAGEHPDVVARMSALLRGAACPTCDVDYANESACEESTCEALAQHGAFTPHCSATRVPHPPMPPGTTMYGCAEHKCEPNSNGRYNTSKCRGVGPDGCGGSVFTAAKTDDSILVGATVRRVNSGSVVTCFSPRADAEGAAVVSSPASPITPTLTAAPPAAMFALALTISFAPLHNSG